VPNLLSLRLVLAPAYTRLAIERFPRDIAGLLESYSQLPDDPDVFAAADWHLHRALTIASGNPVFTLILNTFTDLYHTMARQYFDAPRTRQASRGFYGQLLAAARNGDPAAAEHAASRAMKESLELWGSLSADQNRNPP
jgi:GntR family negative regulator for fad regulon and positive regulator of fabA